MLLLRCEQAEMPSTDSPWTLPRNVLAANYRMAAALRETGYCYQHTVCEDAGHVDGRVLQQTVAGALEWLWADYDPQR